MILDGIRKALVVQALHSMPVSRRGDGARHRHGNDGGAS
jgi:hypothetical protein